MDSCIGYDVDEIGGARVGRVHAAFADAESGEPAWLVVSIGRRRKKKVAIPFRECAGAGGRVWTAQRLETLRTAPAVDPSRPLLREHEAVLCEHYGIGERDGRHAEVVARAEGSVTAQPALPAFQ
jgi:hypothetical protein